MGKVATGIYVVSLVAGALLLSSGSVAPALVCVFICLTLIGRACMPGQSKS